MDPLVRLQNTLQSLLIDSSEVFPKCSEVLRICKDQGWNVAVMGGFLRDLDIVGIDAIPRDIDLVIEGPAPSALHSILLQRFGHVALNSYGGFKVTGDHTSMDIWSVEQTWAFKQGFFATSLENLPKTTFLNLDSLVAIYDGNSFRCLESGYITATETKTIGVNFKEAPGSVYSVMKTLTLAVKYGFAMEWELLSFLKSTCSEFGLRKLALLATEEHRRHYKPSMLNTNTVGAWLRMICQAAAQKCTDFKLPVKKPRIPARG